jgi:hypothetical protein
MTEEGRTSTVCLRAFDTTTGASRTMEKKLGI